MSKIWFSKSVYAETRILQDIWNAVIGSLQTGISTVLFVTGLLGWPLVLLSVMLEIAGRCVITLIFSKLFRSLCFLATLSRWNQFLHSMLYFLGYVLQIFVLWLSCFICTWYFLEICICSCLEFVLGSDWHWYVAWSRELLGRGSLLHHTFLGAVLFCLTSFSNVATLIATH